MFNNRLHPTYVRTHPTLKSYVIQNRDKMVQTVSKNSTFKENKLLLCLEKVGVSIGTLYSCQTDISDRICAGVQ